MNSDLHARAKGVFLRAIALPNGERGPFVDHECGENSSLRAEVTSLLAHHRAETLIVTPSTTARPDARKTVAPAAPAGRRLMHRAWRAISRLRSHGRVALGALVAMLLVGLLFGWVHRNTEATLRQILGEKLRGMLDADVAAVELWIESKKARVDEWSSDPAIRNLAEELLGSDMTRSLAAPQQAAIHARLQELARSDPQYMLWDRTQTVVADSSPQFTALARIATPAGAKLLSRTFHGDTVLCVERPGEPLAGSAPVDRPILSIIAPLEDDNQQIVAALMIRDVDRDDELNRILGYVYTGTTGECYAFDRDGVMLTESRFNDELARHGLLSSPQARSATVVSLRDPGGKLGGAYRTTRSLAACPLTKMAAHAVAGEDGTDLDGYRDYRGADVIGAWRWLPKYNFGMAIEIDRWEAFAPLKYLDLAFGGLLWLLAAALAAVVISWGRVARLRREAGAARQLGQYSLEELIGEGGMGRVYRARHCLLKRPTAVKMLKADCATAEMLARFEREVQLSSQLVHPNTIEIYDYGCASNDVFYYAMEYIDGLNLAQVVALAGPLPAARVVHVLRQVCASLREAHGLGLLHRDIKPQNIMLCCRGGEADVVKVLDFGLVKEMAADGASGTATSTVLAGTPLYMSPERLLDPHSVGAPSDLYSVGAVGYKLLTGKDVFSDGGATSLLAQILETPAPRPSEHTHPAIPRELDDLIVACLAKCANDRPTSAASMLAALDAIGSTERWDEREALEWWERFAAAHCKEPTAWITGRLPPRQGQADPVDL